jgi:hypothetical protein
MNIWEWKRRKLQMKIINKRKFITRISELLVIIVTSILTPIAINYANNLRGHQAYGGEYLIPILGLTIIMIIETIYEEISRR